MPSSFLRLRTPSVQVLAAAVVSGLAGYLVLIFAARTLSPSVNAYFLVFWGALFTVYGVLTGITTEMTRAIFAHGGRGRTPVLPVAFAVGGGGALLLAGSGPLWAPQLFGDRWPQLMAVMCVGVLLFTVHVSLAGAASGTGSWRRYSMLVALEPTTRLVLSGGAALATAGVVGFAWAAAAASGTWLLLCLLSARFRALWRVRTDHDRWSLAGRVLAACAAAGVSSLLLVGYPVLLRLTTPDAVFDHAAPLVLAVSLSRAPLLVPLAAYQNVVVTRVVGGGARALVPVVGGLAVVTLAGTLASWLLGPWLLRLVNPDYHVSGGVFAALLAAAGLLALLSLTGAATLALDRHGYYVTGWLVATAAALLVLLAPGSLEARVVSSLLVGPVAGVVVHLAAIAGASARVARPRRATPVTADRKGES